ncbi:hypothetical protein [Cecembia rubra]|uniref:Uncharacterized protein n=1 Tax=Cecembia rubra TaxID=1485585 RepID=A0A2P8E0L9_9BACT|nr:hypothetical protein [Cecembia rubra]PSL03024.1 hypothetical protein CLV48_108134 [Cecembia rubra]
MNKGLKISILIALKNGLLSKVEAKTLINSKGIIKLDLSTHGMPDPVCPIIDRMPDLKQYFIRIIDLGHGENPQMEQI